MESVGLREARTVGFRVGGVGADTHGARNEPLTGLLGDCGAM